MRDADAVRSRDSTLTEAIRVATDMHEEYAVEHPEQKLDAVNAVANYSNPNPERVKPRGR